MMIPINTVKVVRAPKIAVIGYFFPFIDKLNGIKKGLSRLGSLNRILKRDMWAEKKAIMAPKLYRSAIKSRRPLLIKTIDEARTAKNINAMYGLLNLGCNL